MEIFEWRARSRRRAGRVPRLKPASSGELEPAAAGTAHFQWVVEATAFQAVEYSRVPGMPVHWWGESPHTNLMEVKVSRAQGRHREVGSEGSV